MSLFIYVAWIKSEGGAPPVPRGVYIGENGVEGQERYDALVKEGVVARGLRVVNPSGASLPVDPTPTTMTKPTHIERPKPFKTPPVAEPLRHLADANDKLRKEREAELLERQRKQRLNPSGGEPKADDVKQGPTLEEYVARGYKPESYPPMKEDGGRYAEVPSPGLEAFRAQQKAALEEKAKADAEAVAKAARVIGGVAEEAKQIVNEAAAIAAGQDAKVQSQPEDKAAPVAPAPQAAPAVVASTAPVAKLDEAKPKQQKNK
jgi:hypothetical protein